MTNLIIARIYFLRVINFRDLREIKHKRKKQFWRIRQRAQENPKKTEFMPGLFERANNAFADYFCLSGVRGGRFRAAKFGKFFRPAKGNLEVKNSNKTAIKLTKEKNMPNQEEDKASIGLCVLSFIIPIAGIILWAIKKNEVPNAAKTYLMIALAVIVLGVAFNLLNVIF